MLDVRGSFSPAILANRPRSWKQALEAVTNIHLAKNCANLGHFLQDEQTIQALQADLGPHKVPTSQTKAEFQAKTAAINVTPSHNGHFDMQQIKEDTLWLSKSDGIDELSALRLVILEWQQRPNTEILHAFETEELGRIQQATGNAGYEGSRTGASGLDTPSRQRRIVLLSLSERECFLSLSFALRALALRSMPVPPVGRTYGASKAELNRPLVIQGILPSLSARASAKQKSTDEDCRIFQAIDLLGKAMRRRENSDVGSVELDGIARSESLLSSHHLSILTLLLKLIFVHIAGLSTWASASSVQKWFDFVDKIYFFENLQPVCQQKILNAIHSR